MPIEDWTPEYEFEDGPGNTASGEQVMENLRSLGTFLLGEIQGGEGMPLILKSNATDPQDLTASFEAMEDLDGSASQLTVADGLTVGVTYAVQVVAVFTRSDARSGDAYFRVRSGAVDVIGDAAHPKGGNDVQGGGLVELGSIPDGESFRIENWVGWFESDGSAVELDVKCDASGVDSFQVERSFRTFVLLYPTG